MARPSGVTAQSLNAELLQHIFALLSDDQDRKAALAVCRSWHAAAAANPCVWPVVELWGHYAAPLQADLSFVAEAGPAGLLWLDSYNAASNLEGVAAVPARAQRVRLRGFRETVSCSAGWVQPATDQGGANHVSHPPIHVCSPTRCMATWRCCRPASQA